MMKILMKIVIYMLLIMIGLSEIEYIIHIFMISNNYFMAIVNLLATLLVLLVIAVNLDDFLGE